MSNARGDEAKLLARVQSAYGTAESAADGAYYALPFYSVTINPDEELNEDEAIYGDAFPGDAVAGLRNLTGAMAVPLGLNSFGWHLRNLMGTPTTTELEVGVKYQHVFKTAAQPVIGLVTQCLTHTRVAQHFVQDSLACSGLEFQARKNGERARATVNMIGRAETPNGSTLDTTPVSFSPDPTPVGFVGKCLFDGTEAAGVTGAGLTLNSGLEADQETLNGLSTATAINVGRWDLTGSLDARFIDRDMYDKANAGTAFALHLKWTFDADHDLELVAHNIRLERTGIPVDGRGIISHSYNFKANRPATGQTLLTATLKNKAADYNNPV